MQMNPPDNTHVASGFPGGGGVLPYMGYTTVFPCNYTVHKMKIF